MFRKLRRNDTKDYKEQIRVDERTNQGIIQTSKNMGMTKSEFIREAITDKIKGIGDGLHYKLERIKDKIQSEQEIIDEQMEIINKHQERKEKLENEYIKLEKLVNQSNIVYAADEKKIKEVILTPLTNPDQRFWNNTSLEQVREMIIKRAGSVNVDADVHIVTKLTDMILDNELTLRELIEKPVQHIIDTDAIEELDDTNFKDLRNSLWKKYGRFIEQKEEQQKALEEEANIKSQPENKRIQWTIKELFKREYRTTKHMKGYLQTICEYTTNVDYEKVLSVVERIYSKELDYEKVISSDNILDLYSNTVYESKKCTTNQESNQKECTTKEDFTKQNIKSIVKMMNKKEPLKEVRNINVLEGNVFRMCRQKKVAFNEVWQYVMGVVDGKLSMNDIENIC